MPYGKSKSKKGMKPNGANSKGMPSMKMGKKGGTATAGPMSAGGGYPTTKM